MPVLATLLETIRLRAGERSVRADAVRIYLLQFITVGIGLVSSVIVARTLGPSEKGIVDLFRVFTTFLSDFGLLGFGSGLLYYLANRHEPLARIHGTGLAFAALMGALTIGVGLLLSPWLDKLFSGLPAWMLLLGLGLAPFAYYTLIWSNIVTGLNRAVLSYRMSSVFSGVNLAAVLLLWALGYLGPGSVVVVAQSLALLNALVALIILLRIEPRLSPSLELARNSLRYSLVVYLGFLANTLHFKIDQLMISAWLGTAALGIYAVSVRWVEMLFLLDSAIIAAALYKIGSSPPAQAYQLTNRVLRTQLLISGGAGALLALAAYPVVMLIYGADYQDAIVPMFLLIPGIISWSLAKVMSQYISYNRGRQWWPSFFAIGGLLVNVALNSVLIPLIGIRGASLASTFSYGAVMLATYVAFRKFGQSQVG
ncbi:MAG TPA: oligosaccharide flippase family protein [Caldilineaceae bacterium]|nr:oligosaccharide flippase family protein [Caldilineaceae bacterium]